MRLSEIPKTGSTTGLTTRDRFRRQMCLLMTVCMTLNSVGCTSMLGAYSVTGIPVSRVPRQILQAERKDDYEDISPLRLRQDPPEFYALGPGDVLGVYIRGVLGDEDKLPPVHYPENSNLPPAVGYPVPVREDGTLALPIVRPVKVEGLSLIEATEAVRRAYTIDEDILPDDEQFSLTMIRQRTVRVMVIREESGGAENISKRGTGHIVDLPAYENDVLHALGETGGMPGLDAKNEVLIYRGLFRDAANYDMIMNQYCQGNCNPDDPCFCDESPAPDPPNLTRIPLRYHPSNPPIFTKEQILLSDGDVVIIRSRDKETFYTAGLLGGGEHFLPRDKDLDVIGAIALAGGPLGNGGTAISAIGQGQGGGGAGGFGGNSGGRTGYCQPSEVLIIRELPCGSQITLKVDLNRALQNPAERVLIQPGDVVMLRYTLTEEIGNTVLSLIQFNFLFSG
ncbi:MAG: polysaccharide biosynthesis/export family protein, partial [Planctomycetaceae bacterium]|nr:polysaccharide biosynthesis/export family protein [Planctomycetaceae bacterium]